MSSTLSNASITLMKREKVRLVAATGLIFEHLKKTSPDITLDKSLISYKGGIWGNKSLEGVGFPILRSSNMRGKRVDVSEAAWCSVPEDKAASFALESGDILVTKSSGSVDLVGKATLFDDPNDGDTYLFSNFTMRLRPDRKKVIPEYLAWFLRSPQAFSWRFEAQQTTVGLRNLQTKEYLSQEIPIPDLDVQQQIVDYLNALEDENRDSNHLKLPTTLTEQRRIVAHIESLAARVNAAQRLREEADIEVDFLVKSSLSEIFDYEYGDKLPQGWKWKSFNETLMSGGMRTGPFGTALNKSEIFSEGVPVFGIPNVGVNEFRKGFTDFVTPEKAKSLSGYELNEGDIAVARSGTVGRSCVVPKGLNPKPIMSSNLIRIRIDEKVFLPELMCRILNGSKLVEKHIDKECRGSTRIFFTQKILGKFQIPIPPLDEQRRIVAYLDGLQAKVNAFPLAAKRLGDDVRGLQSTSGEQLLLGLIFK